MESEVTVERGELTDVQEAKALVAGARQWLADRSIDQWQDPLPDRVIEADVHHGRLFVIREAEGLAGMLSIAHSDEETWGPDPAHALYVHRLTVAQRHRGAQLGRKLLRWARTYALEHGSEWLRLDCAADNPGLRRFYELAGFTYVRDEVVPSPDGRRSLRVSLYQRAVEGP